MDYIGKYCPYCHTAFVAEDDIVVCNDCEMPHHKDCWIANKGCTTFGCQGTVQSVIFDDDTSISSAPKYETRNDLSDQLLCSKCGATIELEQKYCSRCGAQVNLSPIGAKLYDTQSALQNLVSKFRSQLIQLLQKYRSSASVDSNLDVYIGTQKTYYQKAFTDIKDKGKYIVWNWPAFLISPFWFMYRKMYKPGILLAIIQLILVAIKGFLSTVLVIGISCLCGCLANYFYFYILGKKLEKEKALPFAAKSEYIQKNCDVDTMIPSIASIVYMLICVLILR